MFKHLHQQETTPERVVILGANGFVGNAAKQRLITSEINVLPLSRQELDLLSDDAAERLALTLKPSDAVLVVSAQAPCKNVAMLMNNFRMMEAVCAALEKKPVNHIIYISSDAVYADSNQPLTESSSTAAASLHGIMHITREMMLQAVKGPTPLLCLRPSLLYGAADPHNGYGPNQFRRLTAKGNPVTLFGEGEEERDHVFIDDLAELIYRCFLHRSEGILNIATGEVNSFMKIAKMVNTLLDQPVAINSRPRQGPMPHNGYRPFDITLCQNTFPNFHYTPLEKGLAITHSQMLEGVGA